VDGLEEHRNLLLAAPDPWKMLWQWTKQVHINYSEFKRLTKWLIAKESFDNVKGDL